jgi:hypothetical protein
MKESPNTIEGIQNKLGQGTTLYNSLSFIVKSALASDNLTKNELLQLNIALEDTAVQMEKYYKENAKIREPDERFSFANPSKSPRNDTGTLRTSEPTVKDFNVQYLQAKEEELDKFLAEETAKLEKATQDLKFREAELKAMETDMEARQALLASKHREMENRINELRIEPLLCLGDHEALKERLLAIKGKLLNYYMDEIRQRKYTLPEDIPMLEELKQESKVFWDQIAYETKPTNLKQVIDFVKTYEIYLIYEKAQMDIIASRMRKEVEELTEQKEELLREVS